MDSVTTDPVFKASPFSSLLLPAPQAFVRLGMPFEPGGSRFIKRLPGLAARKQGAPDRVHEGRYAGILIRHLR
jgi:hypothetical protein